MARTIYDLETNKNAVIFWHMGHPPYEEKKPYGCSSTSTDIVSALTSLRKDSPFSPTGATSTKKSRP